MFQALHQLRSPSLDTLQGLDVLLVVRGPKLNTVLEVRPHQSRVQGDDHLPGSAGHTIPDTSQDALGLLGHLGTLLLMFRGKCLWESQVSVSGISWRWRNFSGDLGREGRMQAGWKAGCISPLWERVKSEVTLASMGTGIGLLLVLPRMGSL